MLLVRCHLLQPIRRKKGAARYGFCPGILASTPLWSRGRAKCSCHSQLVTKCSQPRWLADACPLTSLRDFLPLRSRVHEGSSFIVG